MDELDSALFSTSLLIMSGSVCSKCLNDHRSAAISFIAWAALASLINFVSFKRYKHSEVAMINIGTTMIAGSISIALKYGLFIDKFKLISPSL